MAAARQTASDGHDVLRDAQMRDGSAEHPFRQLIVSFGICLQPNQNRFAAENPSGHPENPFFERALPRVALRAEQLEIVGLQLVIIELYPFKTGMRAAVSHKLGSFAVNM